MPCPDSVWHTCGAEMRHAPPATSLPQQFKFDGAPDGLAGPFDAPPHGDHWSTARQVDCLRWMSAAARSECAMRRDRQPWDLRSAKPEISTCGRLGKRAISDRLPPMASIVLRNVESRRSVRCSIRDTASWLTPSSRAMLTWVRRRALRNSRSVISSEMNFAASDAAPCEGRCAREAIGRTALHRGQC